MNIQELLKTIDPTALSNESATAIAEAFKSAVEERVKIETGIQVEAALKSQDEDHATKLAKLLETIDEDHTKKLQKVVESINQNHTAKLNNIQKLHQKSLNEKASKFSDRIVEEISNYLDLYLEKALPQEQLEKAVNNTQAQLQLEAIKKVISFDPSSVNSEIKNVIKEGNSKINELKNRLNDSLKENINLNEQIKQMKAAILLEGKTKGLSASKKEFVNKILCDKTVDYINENFDYVVNVFEKQEASVSEKLVQEALNESTTRNVKVPKPEQVISESVDTSVAGTMSGYLEALKMKR
jgi:hypothetical protein